MNLKNMGKLVFTDLMKQILFIIILNIIYRNKFENCVLRSRIVGKNRSAYRMSNVPYLKLHSVRD